MLREEFPSAVWGGVACRFASPRLLTELVGVVGEGRITVPLLSVILWNFCRISVEFLCRRGDR